MREKFLLFENISRALNALGEYVNRLNMRLLVRKQPLSALCQNRNGMATRCFAMSENNILAARIPFFFVSIRHQ